MKPVSPPPPLPTLCDKELFETCENNALCALCTECSLYKNAKREWQQKAYNRQENKKERRNDVYREKERKKGMALEKKVQGQWNASFNQKKRKVVKKPRLDLDTQMEEAVSSPSSSLSFNPFTRTVPSKGKQAKSIYGSTKTNEATRQVNSGAMWHSKGDIKLEHALMEVKERGTVNGRGEKTISIPKEWLVKQEAEAFQEQKLFWYLPFAYKNDDQVYLIKPYEHEIQLIQDIRSLEEENERLRNQLNQLQKEGK